MRQLDVLRALAALLVAICHYRHAFPEIVANVLEKFGDYGVFIFFVISGYIIPRVMTSSGYRFTRIHTFMAKRLVRLHPPYIFALLLTLTISAAAAHVRNIAYQWSWTDALQYLFYTAIPNENPVFWTLQVEWFYYAWIAIFYSAINSKSGATRVTVYLGATLTALWGANHLPFFQYLGFFLIGITLEHAQRCPQERLETAMKFMVSASLAWYFSSFTGLVFAFLSCLTIAGLNNKTWPKFILFLGTISYSFYLVHFPVGVKFLNLCLARFPDIPPTLLFLGALTLSGLAAFILYKSVEEPSMYWASLKK